MDVERPLERWIRSGLRHREGGSRTYHLEMDFRLMNLAPDLLLPVNTEALPTSIPPCPKRSVQGPKYGSSKLKLVVRQVSPVRLSRVLPLYLQDFKVNSSLKVREFFPMGCVQWQMLVLFLELESPP